jgi:hypothetical protein
MRELYTLLAIAAACAVCARPLLEEWGFIVYFNGSGFWSYFHLVHQFPLRPLQGIPVAIQWVLGGGNSAGFASGFFLLLLAKYLSARWAVSTLYTGNARWLIATLAALLAPWPAEWLLRYSAAQLSAVWFFVAMGASIRCARRVTLLQLLIGSTAMLLTLLTYQALSVLGIALAAFGLTAVRADQISWTSRPLWRSVLRAVSPAIVGYVMYLVYAYFAARINGGSGYDGGVAESSRYDSLHGIVSSIGDLYHTVYIASPWTLILLATIVLYLLGSGRVQVGSGTCGWQRPTLILIAVATLPLWSAPYAVNTAFSADPERVMFPVSVAFVVLCAVVLATTSPAESSAFRASGASLVVALLLVSTAFLASQARDYHNTQRDVVLQTIRLAKSAKATNVLLWDYSGTLGDVYTMLPPVLQQELTAMHSPLRATICTPRGIDRYQPVARRLLIATTPTCEDLPASSRPLLNLDVVVGKHGLTVRPIG